MKLLAWRNALGDLSVTSVRKAIDKMNHESFPPPVGQLANVADGDPPHGRPPLTEQDHVELRGTASQRQTWIRFALDAPDDLSQRDYVQPYDPRNPYDKRAPWEEGTDLDRRSAR